MDEQYFEYLQSDEWKTKATTRLKIDNYTCQGCGCRGTSDNPLQVHHLTYKNIMHENPYADLVTLCRNCHIRTHSIMDRITDENGRRGWHDVAQVPRVHIYTLSGYDLHRFEDTSNQTKGR